MLSSLAALVLAAAGLFISYVVYYRFLHALARYPGPPIASLTDAWAARRVVKGDWHTCLADWHAKHGPVIRVGPNEVSILDAGACKAIYAAGSGFRKTEFYRAFNDPRADAKGIANLFSTRDEGFHAERRRQVGSAYSMKALLTFRGYIDNVVERFVAHLDGFASSGKPFDLAHELAKLAADVASELAFGGGLKCIEGDPMGVLDAVEQSQIAGALIGRMPSLQPIFFNAAVQRLLAGSPVSKTFAALGQHVDDQVKSHMAQPDARHDMLSLMLESALRGASKKADSGERPIPLDNIALESFGIALAGTDTTSITMAAFFSYVLRDPRVLALLQAECDEHRNPDEESPYLRAVLNETFRLHPAVSFPLPRIVPAGGAVLAGQHFPAGTRVGVNAWHLHRLPEIFGDDVQAFRPERWLPAEGEAEAVGASRIQLMERTLFQFGGGAHTCIGRNISLLELRCAIPTILRAFTLELVQPRTPLKVQSAWFAYVRDLQVTIKRRV